MYLPVEFSLFSYNNGTVMSSCRPEMDNNNRSALSAASAFAIATAGANEGTPTKEKYRRMSLASTGTQRIKHQFCPQWNKLRTPYFQTHEIFNVVFVLLKRKKIYMSLKM